MKIERIVFMYTTIIEAISKITLKFSITIINLRSYKNNLRLRFPRILLSPSRLLTENREIH
jgi:hypothetical protein